VTAEPDSTPNPLRGAWRVERIDGLLPPIGVAKQIGHREGVTTLFGVPVGMFRLEGGDLAYRWLPIRDRLTADADGGFTGEALLFGRRFGRFRLLPVAAPADDDPSG
jgi:hypothetical protein